MAENKTRQTTHSVAQYLASIENDRRRNDCKAVMKLMREATGKRARMWGSSLIGFGSYHYKYDSGREGDMPLTGVSPRKQNLVVYIMPGFRPYNDLMKRLGRHKTGKSCLYINNLADIDLSVLSSLIRKSARDMEKKYS